MDLLVHRFQPTDGLTIGDGATVIKIINPLSIDTNLL